MNKPKLIYPDGKIEELDAVPDYNKAQELLSRGVERQVFVELVTPRNAPDIFFLCDEEGLLHDDQNINPTATVLYNIPGHRYSPILGPIILMERTDKVAAALWLSSGDDE